MEILWCNALSKHAIEIGIPESSWRICMDMSLAGLWARQNVTIVLE